DLPRRADTSAGAHVRCQRLGELSRQGARVVPRQALPEDLQGRDERTASVVDVREGPELTHALDHRLAGRPHPVHDYSRIRPERARIKGAASDTATRRRDATRGARGGGAAGDAMRRAGTHRGSGRNATRDVENTKERAGTGGRGQRARRDGADG